MKRVGEMGGAMLSLSSYNLRDKDGFLSLKNKVVICWRSHKHLGGGGGTHHSICSHGFLSHVGDKQRPLILDRRDMICFSKHASWSTSCTAETWRQRECKSEGAGRAHHAEDSVDLCVFWQEMAERMVRRAQSQTPHTLNLYTQLADDQILSSPLSPQHTPTKFPFCPPAPPTAFLTPPRSAHGRPSKNLVTPNA